jgi:hypothetical protein
MAAKGLEGDASAEAAGYDPPFTPGFLRRNEILVRLKDAQEAEVVSDAQTGQ